MNPTTATARTTPDRSVPSRLGSAPSPSSSTTSPHLQQSYYGINNSARQNLEDDDPSTNAYMNHFNLPTHPTAATTATSSSLPGGMPSSGELDQGREGRPLRPRLAQTTTIGSSMSVENATVTAESRRVEARRRREERSAQRRADNASNNNSNNMRRNSGDSASSDMSGRSEEYAAGSASHAQHSHSSVVEVDESSSSIMHQASTPSAAHSTSSTGFPPFPPGGSGLSRTSSVVVGGDSDLLRTARENSEKLRSASSLDDVDTVYVTELLESCHRDQERLQEKLSAALEEADAIENLEELFRVNDGICSAIETGKDTVKREKELAKKKKKKVDGPTIDLLVDNEDVFSLICMLRAPNEKRLQAALALMKFAKENEMLRNEIRSSGGMHSFLTLFRTKGMPREMQVVSCMAVAYVLPSFVTSSQTASSVGLKIIECLRYLAISNPVSPNGLVISRQGMCFAASSGVHVLWIHVVQPLLSIEQAKKASRKTKPILRPSHSSRLLPGRSRPRYGGGIFDQGQESIEIQELTDLSVTLIAYLTRLTQSDGMKFQIGYGIVEQVCEVDQARPIAVREGMLALFVHWIRSGDVDKIRPAASALRYLISIQDKYMAGWIHSQVVNEGAIAEIVKLLNESVGHDVRVAVAQMLSALCIAPHTRAAVVEANCVNYLVALLYEHSSPDSEEMVFCAGSALLQLAAGTLTRPSALTVTDNIPLDRGEGSLQKQEDVINDIIEGWAHGSFVQIALDHTGKLRSVSVEALRVLSEDTDSDRQTRLQLCSAGAAEALGLTIHGHSSTIEPLSTADECLESGVGDIVEGSLAVAVKDTYESLRGLANMMEPQKVLGKKHERLSSSLDLNPKDLLIKACMDVAKSGGLKGILWVASLDATSLYFVENADVTIDRIDLLEEGCRLLANLSPLLLSQTAAENGVTKWSSDVFEGLDSLLRRLNGDEDGSMSESVIALIIDALKGMAQLAVYEPLKIRIVNHTLPKLLLFKSISGDRNDIATAANQVLLSLGFTEDEITVQVAGNNPQLLVDWFCLQRALLLQAMARYEIRGKVLDLWQLPFSETEQLEEMGLVRQISQQSGTSDSTGENNKSDDSECDAVIGDLFENFANDYDSRETRSAVVRQYRDVYDPAADSSRRNLVPGLDTNNLDAAEEHLLSPHVFPLNDVREEKEWILHHQRSIEACKGLQKFSVSSTMPERVEKLLDCCFPSKLLRNDVVPVNDLRPQASFNFRALLMPKRRYFSFRREGQILTRMCDKNASKVDSDDIYWTLGFTNSTFAGEFVESLVQTLYLCPMITGLSFVRNSEWLMMRDTDKDVEGDDGGGLLANLTGSLPPWVSFLTFDNMLGDRDMRALVAILDTMGRLSSGQDFDDDTTQVSDVSIGQSQGKFNCFSIRNSPNINRETWSSFFQMVGKVGPAKRNPAPPPLAYLKSLDLAGNKLGDELAAMVLELVHDKESCCSLERLDLSGNRIGRGSNVIRVLSSYTEYYRYNQTVGVVKMVRKSWKSSLHTLVLAENDLFLGQAGLEFFALLKHNALCLRCLDLSNNSLEGDAYQMMASSLLKNTSLCHLNLSGNKFSPALIDLVLEDLNRGDTESSLSFLAFENNSPPLNDNHRSMLANFLRKSRKNAIERYLKEKQNEEDTPGGSIERQGNDLDMIDEDTTTVLARESFAAGRNQRPSLQESVDSDDPGDNKVTVLFSAPLVFADGDSKLHPFEKLDFDMERELLWQCMKEASRDIDMSFDNAHHSRLLATVTRRCNVLHYSGHGHPNFLPFEDGIGGPNWLSVKNIKELILRDGMAPFKFVFVSACHSGLAGETFASAGVPHVVCCKQEFELKDTAALAFTRSFYLALLVGHTVKESFEQGKKAVRATPNLKDPVEEMKKFVLLPHDGDHNVPVFNAKPIREWPKQPRQEGPPSSKTSRRRGSRNSLLVRMHSVKAFGAKNSELSVRNMMQEDPSPTAPQFFLGREVDMYYILSALIKLKKRLVTVVGETGIGRSSLVCSLCHYINERASTISEIQHIYFIKPKHGGRNVTCLSLLRQLVDKLEENDKCRPVDEDVDVEGMLDVICKSLKHDKALIVFDRTELLEKTDESQELPMILSTIMYDTKQVKVIITARNAIGQPSIGGQVEHPFKLGPLNFCNTVKLFVNLCPHLHTPSERVALSKSLTSTAGGDDVQKELLPNDRMLNERTRDIFSMLGNGIPSRIEKAAYSISKEELQDLAEK